MRFELSRNRALGLSGGRRSDQFRHVLEPVRSSRRSGDQHEISRIGVVAIAALIAGCSGGSQPALAPAPLTSAARFGADPLHLRGGLDAFAAVHAYGPLHRDRRKSWIAPEAKRRPRLMFASDSEHGDVYIYSLPDMTLKGTLTGFYEPQGLCSTRAATSTSRTPTTPDLRILAERKVLQDLPRSIRLSDRIAVDPASGNLAVTNAFGFSGAGQVLIFAASEPPTDYHQPRPVLPITSQDTVRATTSGLAVATRPATSCSRAATTRRAAPST